MLSESQKPKAPQAPARDFKRTKATHIFASKEAFDEGSIVRALENEHLYLSTRRCKQCTRESLPLSLSSARSSAESWIRKNPRAGNHPDWNKGPRKVKAAQLQDMAMSEVEPCAKSSSSARSSAETPPEVPPLWGSDSRTFLPTSPWSTLPLDTASLDLKILENSEFMSLGPKKWTESGSRSKKSAVRFINDVGPDGTIYDGSHMNGAGAYFTRRSDGPDGPAYVDCPNPKRFSFQAPKFYDGDTMGAAVSQLLETCDRVISFCYKWTTAYNNILGGPVGMAWSQREKSGMILYMNQDQASIAVESLVRINAAMSEQNGEERCYIALFITNLSFGANLHSKLQIGADPGGFMRVLQRSANIGVAGSGLNPKFSSLETSTDEAIAFGSDPANQLLDGLDKVSQSLVRTGVVLENLPASFSTSQALEDQRISTQRYGADKKKDEKRKATEKRPVRQLGPLDLATPPQAGLRPAPGFAGASEGGLRQTKDGVQGLGLCCGCGRVGPTTLISSKGRPRFRHPGGYIEINPISKCMVHITPGLRGAFRAGLGIDTERAIMADKNTIEVHNSKSPDGQHRYGPLMAFATELEKRQISIQGCGMDVVASAILDYLKRGGMPNGDVVPNFVPFSNLDPLAEPLFEILENADPNLSRLSKFLTWILGPAYTPVSKPGGPAIRFESLAEMDKANSSRFKRSTADKGMYVEPPAQASTSTSYLARSRDPTAADNGDEHLLRENEEVDDDEGFGLAGPWTELEIEYEVTPEDLLEDWLQAEDEMEFE